MCHLLSWKKVAQDRKSCLLLDGGDSDGAGAGASGGDGGASGGSGGSADGGASGGSWWWRW